jgi:heme/copper-type cytochrome/quinol oxidase subunit 3
MTSAPNYAETLKKFRARNSDGLGKGRETKGLLIKPKEYLQLLKKQIKSQPALQEEELNHQRELKQVPGGSNTARQGSEGQTTTWSTLTEGTTITLNIGIELGQVLKNSTARSIAVQPVHDVGRGNDDEVNDLASFSFGSGMEYLAETYVYIHSKRTVFIPVFTRYFLARERSFQVMIEDHFIRDALSGTEKYNIALVKLHMTMSQSESSPSVDISPHRRGRTSGSPFDRGCTGPTQRQAKDWLGSGTEYLAETYVLIDPEPGPSGGHGDHTKVEAQTGATSQGVATSPKKKGRVPPAVQPVHDVGRGNDGEVNNLASLSFRSGTEYLSETYVLIDSERTVFILVFTTYFLARERSFQIMIEYLLKHRKTSQDGKHPLAMSPKKKDINQESPDMHTGELHVPPAVQPVHDVGRGNDGEENDLASLSFGSCTEYLAETYVLIDSECTVFILVFTRYFLARERSFQVMIEHLLKHKKPVKTINIL